MNEDFSHEIGERLAKIVSIHNLNTSDSELIAQAALDRLNKIENSSLRRF
jgi:hypothetical protein